MTNRFNSKIEIINYFDDLVKLISGNLIINKDITLYPLANGGNVLFKYSQSNYFNSI